VVSDPLFDFLFIILLGLVMFFIIHMFYNSKKKKEVERQRVKLERNKQHKFRTSGIEQIDEMTGEEFEEYLQQLFLRTGFKRAVATSKTSDYGADLILYTDSKVIIIQAKRYSGKVGVKAVQEIVSAKNHYGADDCWVVTNNYFTRNAIKLSISNDVTLIDRDRLVDWIVESKKLAN
jgi:restriction system protein